MRRVTEHYEVLDRLHGLIFVPSSDASRPYPRGTTLSSAVTNVMAMLFDPLSRIATDTDVVE